MTRLWLRGICLLLHLVGRLLSWSLLLALLTALGLYAGVFVLGQQQTLIQRGLSQALQQEVRLQGLSTAWEDGMPVLRLGYCELRDPQNHTVLFSFTQASVQLDWVASLLQGQLISHHLRLTGGQFTVIHDAQGQIRLAGLPQPDPNAPAVPDTLFVRWLLQQPQIVLTDTRLIWQDSRRQPLQFSQGVLQLHREGDDYALEGRLSLPTARAEPPLAVGLGIETEGGSMRFSVLSAWADARLLRLRGQFTTENLQLHAKRASLALSAVTGDFDLSRTDDGWQMQVDDFSFATRPDPANPQQIARWPLSQITLMTHQQAAHTWLEGRVGFLRLHDLLPLLSGLNPVPPAIRNALRATAPQADLHGTGFSVTPQGWELHTQLLNWRNQAWQALPALRQISGELSLNQDQGQLRLNTRDAEIQTPAYPEPLALRHLHGEVSWQRTTAAESAPWLLRLRDLSASNADVESLVLNGQIQLPTHAGEAPQADLTLHLRRLAMAAIYRYLPNTARQARAWLQRGLTSGLVDKAELSLQGPLRSARLIEQPPGKNGLRGRLQVSQAAIAYSPGWPTLTGVAADLTLEGDTLSIETQAGRVLTNSLGKTRVVVKDIVGAQPLVTVDGRIRSSAVRGLQFVAASPLAKTLDLHGLALDGNIDLGLQLQIPLTDAPMRTQGQLRLLGNTLTTPLLRDRKLALSKLRGTLHFSEDGLNAEALQGRLLATPITLSLQQPAHSADGGLAVGLSGQADVPFLGALFERLSPALLPYVAAVSGSSDWQAQLLYPPQAASARLEIQSTLSGLAVDLPAPLGKAADTARAFRYRSNLETPAPVMIQAGTDLQAVFSPDFSRGQLHFGSAQPPLRTDLADLERGLSLRGQLPSLDLPAWQARLARLFPSSQPSALHARPLQQATDFLTDSPLRLDLQVDKLSVADQHWQQVQLRGTANAAQWDLQLQAQEIAGRLRYQAPNTAAAQLRVDLARWHWQGAPLSVAPQLPNPDYLAAMTRLSHQAAALDPRALPALSLRCQALFVNELALGAWQLDTQPVADGLRLQRLQAVAGNLALEAQGDWLYRRQTALSKGADEQVTQLTATLRSPDFGATLAQLGYASQAIQGGVTRLDFQGDWPGSPFAFNRAYLRGYLDLSIEAGRLIDVEPGAGRIFGLFDLQAVPRRLFLDFRDVFGQGLSFDQIQGRFFIEGGSAYTDQLLLRGPLTDVALAGRTGLLTRTYDQTMRVMPHLSNTLPLVGGLVGGLGVGAAVLALQAVFKDDLKQVVTYDYQITGPWEAPEIVRQARQGHEE